MFLEKNINILLLFDSVKGVLFKVDLECYSRYLGKLDENYCIG